MNPKEKANDLVKKYWLKNRTGQDDFKTAIKNALICVDEILNAVTTIADKKYEYYKEVKEEIENL